MNHPALIMRAGLLSLALAATGCSDDTAGEPGVTTTTVDTTTTEDTTTAADTTTTAAPVELGGTIVFSGQGNDLVAYDLDGNRRLVTPRASDDDPDGRDLNGQVCFLDATTFIAGEDTGQPDVVPGWGIFTLEGNRFDELKGIQIGKLIPTYQAADSQPEMFGCGVMADDRIVLTDVGNQALGAGTGQLMMFFPPDDADGAASYRGEITEHCKLDTAIATAQQVALDDDGILVASARPPTVGVWRYTGLPETIDDCATASKELFIDAADGGLGIANGIARAPDGWYVSSVFTGAINEYDHEGGFVREILRPPDGETLGAEPYSTGTPNGLATTADGTLWYADLGLVISDDGGIGPGSGSGTVRIIRFVDGEPQAPEIIDEGLAFPDAVSVLPFDFGN